MNNVKGAFFDTVGTNMSSYITRYIINVKESKKMFIDRTSGEFIVKNEHGEEITNCGSKTTGNQFVASLEAFGMIKKDIGCYSINFNEFNFKEVTKSIFEYSSDKKVQKIRQSRMISFLAETNIINDKNFTSFDINGKKGKTKYSAVIKEISLWEKEAAKSKNRSIILERIKDYEFKRKI